MNPKLFVLAGIFFMALGCSKDNNQAKPSITLISYTNEVSPDGAFSAKLAYSQQSGDLSGDSLIVIYHRYNATQVPEDQYRGDDFLTYLPETPNASKADITVQMDWASLSYGIPGPDQIAENDTIDLKFILVDSKGNRSDTVKTGKIIVLQN